MTLIEQIRESMAQAPAEASGSTIRVNQETLEVAVRLADWDRLGCLLEEIRLQANGGTPFQPDPSSFVERITYLGETLQVIEAEDGRGHAILRSASPLRSDKTISYFEMTVDREEGLSLARYAYDRVRQERSIVAAPLTRETLERLLFDLPALMTAPLSTESSSICRPRPVVGS
jgi:hypothetical protein